MERPAVKAGRVTLALVLLLGCACGVTSPSEGPQGTTADVECTEGDEYAAVTLALSRPASSAMTFKIGTHDGTAAAPDDYTELHTQIVIPADSTAVAIEIPIIEDGVGELDERFTVTMAPVVLEAASTCTAVVTIHEKYPLRTTPENALQKLRLAYTSRCVPAYLDVLAQDMTFYLSEDDWQGGELPMTWNKAEETTIHENMFADGSNVERIRLTLTYILDFFDPGADPVDPADDRWEYREGVDLRVTVSGDLTYLANSPSMFVFGRDTDQVGPAGEELWEIVDWFDLGDEGQRVEAATWGCIKALYH